MTTAAPAPRAEAEVILEYEREKARQKALFKLRYTVLPTLESVISGTPTGPARDRLTDANIILQLVADEKPNPALDESVAP